MQASEQAKFIDLVTAALGGNATGAQVMQWWRLLEREKLDDIRQAIDTFAASSQHRPTPHNILQILHAKRGPGRLTPQQISEKYPIDLRGTTELLAMRLIDDHGVEKAAALLESQYPTHGAKFVRELAGVREQGST